MAGVARRGSARMAWHGLVGQAWHGVATRGMAGSGKAGKATVVTINVKLINHQEAIFMTIKLKPIQTVRVSLEIVSTSPMIQHKWEEKSKAMMREKHQGKKTKARDVRDPEREFHDACYRMEDGALAIPAMAVKTAIIGAAHKDIGIEKTLVRKALFLVCGPDLLIPIIAQPPIMREDVVRVGTGSADLRYRPEFQQWSAILTFELDTELLQVSDLVNLIDRAGFGIGICEWRPEKGGEYGRFKVNPAYGIHQVSTEMEKAA